MLAGTIALAVALLVILYWLYRFAVAPFRVLAHHGIRGPSPLPIFGNWKTVAKVGKLKFFYETIKCYGPVCGFYIGQKANIVISDLYLLKDVTVKHFDNFHDRTPLPNVFRKAGIPYGLVSAQGEFWRKIRVTLSPTFSSAKIKMMAPLIVDHCTTLVEIFGECADTNKSVEVFGVFGKLTMETIIATAFGRIIDVQRGESDQLVDAANVFFSGATEGQYLSPSGLVFIVSNFPCVEPLIRYIGLKSKVANAFATIYEVGENLVKARHMSPNQQNYKDFLQLMIDATAEDKGEHRRLTDLEIVSQCFTFIVAGYETTANALTYTAYLLALNPDIQEKLIDQIMEYISDHSELSLYNMAQELTYLDMVIQESLRLYPPVPETVRQCTKTCTVGDFVIPEGVVVRIPIWHIHHDPQNWEDPERFYPERFSPEEKAKRHSLAHIPFGWGPRNCIGMRFALLEVKLTLISVLRKYKFVRAPETEDPLEVKIGITMTPKNGVFLKIESHNL